MRTVDDINADLVSLWKNSFPDSGKVYAPMQYKEPKPGSLVFIGLNPSFSSKGWKTLIRRSTRPELDPHAFFQWPNPQDFDADLAHKLEALAHEHYSFFAPHRALADGLNTTWEHFDIFAYRETNQANMRTLAILERGKLEMTDFGKRQFKLFEELLALAQPSAIIVINALASQIYLKMRQPAFDSSAGFYRDPKTAVPVFFSGMLTGARALDRFSRDRLFWQVAHALGKRWKSDAEPFSQVEA